MSTNEDFGFYGEPETQDVDVKGVTDEVSKYVISNMQYPCICLKDNLVMPRHKWEILGKMVHVDDRTGKDKTIAVYLFRKGEMLKAGMIAKIQIKTIIDIIGLNNLVAFNSSKRELLGDRIYTLSC